MAEQAKKFVNRSPRYTIQEDEVNILRFAYKDDKSRTYSTRFIDLSQSGVAFIIQKDFAPNIGDILKIEVPLNDEKSFAWWAKVTRLEFYSPRMYWLDPSLFDEETLFVAVQFMGLPTGHAKMIHEELMQKFDHLTERKRKQFFRKQAIFFLEHFWKFLVLVGCTVFMIWFLWYFSQPSSNYDAEKGAPWGQRYPQFNLEK